VAQGADVVRGKGANVRSRFGGGVLAHWGDNCSVAEGCAADLEGVEEGWDLFGLVIVDCWCARRVGVLGDEVGESWDGLVVG
jgi:hypothetical protein